MSHKAAFIYAKRGDFTLDFDAAKEHGVQYTVVVKTSIFKQNVSPNARTEKTRPKSTPDKIYPAYRLRICEIVIKPYVAVHKLYVFKD